MLQSNLHIWHLIIIYLQPDHYQNYLCCGLGVNVGLTGGIYWFTTLQSMRKVKALKYLFSETPDV